MKLYFYFSYRPDLLDPHKYFCTSTCYLEKQRCYWADTVTESVIELKTAVIGTGFIIILAKKQFYQNYSDTNHPMYFNDHIITMTFGHEINA